MAMLRVLPAFTRNSFAYGVVFLTHLIRALLLLVPGHEDSHVVVEFGAHRYGDTLSKGASTNPLL